MEAQLPFVPVAGHHLEIGGNFQRVTDVYFCEDHTISVWLEADKHTTAEELLTAGWLEI